VVWLLAGLLAAVVFVGLWVLVAAVLLSWW
jgi:hypothetical protein